jgi:UDP-N-acetylglucosamine 2-epimerase (non-hydrolysing)
LKKVLCVFGTRPEAIKMAPVVLELRKRPREFRVRVAVTAQHRGMLDQVLGLFGVRSDHDLDIMRPGQSLTDVSVRALAGLEPVLRRERPDLVLVHGDTTTTLMAALAAYYQRVPVGHVEAGLRSGDAYNPFPEEINRRLADAVCALHFAPTPSARRNLLEEGVSPRGIFVTGNTGIDALRWGVEALARGRWVPNKRWAALARGPFVLVTAHRRENFGRPLRDVFGAIADVSRARPHLRFVYPVHPNPNVDNAARAALGNNARVSLIPPLEYGDLLYFLQKALFVLTDSGGLQEEAPSLGKPVLVLRRVTERPEAVRAGTVTIIGTERAAVRRWILRLLDDRALYRSMANAVNPYGDGRAAERTVGAIRYFFRLQPRRPDGFALKNQ